MASFRDNVRYDFQWPAFARFYEIQPGVTLPINPQWSHWPMWAVIPPHRDDSARARSFPIDVGTGNEFPIVFSSLEVCPNSTMVGIEAKLWRQKEGMANLRWGMARDRIPAKNTLLRYYPKDTSVMHFAVTRQSSEVHFEFTPTTNESAAKIEYLKVFCL